MVIEPPAERESGEYPGKREFLQNFQKVLRVFREIPSADADVGYSAVDTVGMFNADALSCSGDFVRTPF